ncbi:zf-HC2 domain-containing protein [Rubeoparvulum massiliense]|uniref:zf-HC2 domain-containing protein n=1 Tax=Rubeoparvulum massiliense TaxID=1631346 RepID=UPI00065E3FFC|nr:zf-HC2 domain-containing protein [Rubeoparvulum massiliense]
MKCEEVQAKLLDMEAGRLSEIECRYIMHHLKGCLDCAEEHQVIKRSMEWVEPEHQVHSSQFSTDNFMMGNIMDRIREENKWAVPITKRKFQLSEQLRRVGSLIAVLLLVTLSLSFMFITVQDSRVTDIDKSWVQLSWAESQADSSALVEENSVVASISEPVVYTVDQFTSPIDYWIIGTLFGTTIIVLGMCWLTRVS